jgi:menaquinone-specific isochorismate synthase
VTGVTQAGGASGLVAVRRPLGPGPALDPFKLAGPTGIVFQSAQRIMVGLGTALALPLPHGLTSPVEIAALTGRLASIECDDEYDPDTSGVVAFGTLPFDRTAAGVLVVPEIVYAVEASGAEWLTVVAPDPADLPVAATDLRAWLRREAGLRSAGGPVAAGSGGGPPRGPSLGEPLVTPRLSDDSFEAMVAEAVAAVRSGDVAKVVVARQVDVRMREAIDVVSLLRRWHRLEPSCSVFSMPTPTGQLVGASPELLVEREGRRVRSRPLAGTTDRAGESNGILPRELLASSKDSTEHRMVVEAIGEALTPLCEVLDVPSRPDLVHLHNLTHLGTSVSGTLVRRPDGSVPSALELLGALHPTPAVGGVPRDRALELIARLEPEPRGHYAGAVGYVDARGDGCWMLGIRAVTVHGANARLVAGVGVVEGSEPRTERVETVLKLTAVFDALAPGVPFSTTGQSPPAQAVG